MHRLFRTLLYLTGPLSRLRRSEPVFTALHNSLQSRLRSPPPAYTPSKHVSVRTHSDLSRKGYRPQAVPIALPDDPASRERREAALRARGLLPPRQPRDLLAKETDTNADRPIDGLKKNDSLFSGPDKVHSDADEIARSWRIKNSIWLSDTVPKSNSPGSSTTEGLFIRTLNNSARFLFSAFRCFATQRRSSGSSRPFPTILSIPDSIRYIFRISNSPDAGMLFIIGERGQFRDHQQWRTYRFVRLTRGQERRGLFLPRSHRGGTWAPFR